MRLLDINYKTVELLNMKAVQYLSECESNIARYW